MSELMMGLMGRISSQLHLGQQATPAKMLVALGMLATILKIVPALYGGYAETVFRFIRHSFGS